MTLQEKLKKIMRDMSDRIFEKTQIVVNDEYERLQAIEQIKAAFIADGWVSPDKAENIGVPTSRRNKLNDDLAQAKAPKYGSDS